MIFKENFYISSLDRLLTNFFKKKLAINNNSPKQTVRNKIIMLQLFGGIELAMLTVHNHCNSHLGNLSIEVGN